MNLEISHLTSSKILSQSTRRTFKFSISVHIENFPSFVTSKAECQSVSVNFNNTEWYIYVQLFKYCLTSKEYIRITSSSTEQPETLGVFVCGRRSDRKECSFDVNAIFKFKRPSTAREMQFSQSHKFCFNSTKHYAAWGYRNFAKIDVILALSFFYQIFV